MNVGPEPGCTFCKRGEGADRVVLPKLAEVGPEHPEYMVVVDAPNTQDQARRYFASGGNGKLLCGAFKRAGIDFDRVHVTGATRCWGPRAPVKGHYEVCRAFLIEEIMAFRPKVIITMGPVSLLSVLRLKGVMAQRGSVFFADFFGDPIPVVPTMAIGILYNDQTKDEFLVNDLRRARMVAENGLTEPATTDVTVARSMADVEDIKDLMLSSEIFTFDIESTGLNPLADDANVLCLAFSNEVGFGYVIPLLGQWCRPLWSPAEYDGAVAGIREILTSDITKIATNGMFDVRYQRHKLGFDVRQFALDAQLMYAVHHEERPHNLEHLRTLYTEMTKYESFKEDDKLKELVKLHGYAAYPEETLWQYAGSDADCELRVALQLLHIIHAESKGAGGAFYAMGWR